MIGSKSDNTSTAKSRGEGTKFPVIVTVTMNPAIDKTARADNLRLHALNRLYDVRVNAGGKGINVAAMVSALGGEVLATGFAGGMEGDILSLELNKGRVPHDFIKIRGVPTRTNLKVVDSDGRLTELNEPGFHVSSDSYDLLVDKLRSYCGKDTLFVLSGSLPPGLVPDTYRNLCDVLKASGASVFLDVDGEAFKLAMQSPPHYIKPNKYELLQFFQASEDTGLSGLTDMCRELVQAGVRTVTLSLGPQGAICVTKTAAWYAPALNVDVQSPVGAGDCMVGALSYGLSRGLPLEQCFSLSMAASAGAVMTAGTAPPSAGLVQKLLGEVDMRLL